MFPVIYQLLIYNLIPLLSESISLMKSVFLNLLRCTYDSKHALSFWVFHVILKIMCSANYCMKFVLYNYKLFDAWKILIWYFQCFFFFIFCLLMMLGKTEGRRSRIWRGIGRPGMLQSMGSERVRHDCETEQHFNVTILDYEYILYLWKFSSDLEAV